MLDNKWIESYEVEKPGDEYIYLWLLKYDFDDNNFLYLLDLMTYDEVTRANKFVFKSDKISFIISRCLLRVLIARLAKLTPYQVKLKYNSYGKPYLDDPGSKLKFNLSHSNEFCIVAINNLSDVGIDIEWMNKNIDINEIAADHFSNNEVEKLNGFIEEDRILAFYKIWTRKEAFIKAVGRGLSIPLKSFDVSLDDNTGSITVYDSNDFDNKVNLYNININDEYSSALVNIGKLKTLKMNYIGNFMEFIERA